jgi:Cytochrome c554 and c-prime
MNSRTRSARDILFVFAILAGVVHEEAVTENSRVNRDLTQLTTKRLQEKGWWPTRTDASRSEYIGTEACAVCHKQIVNRQLQTPMAHASWRASETEVLRSERSISHSAPPFQSVIAEDRKGSHYTVTRGGEAKSGEIVWTMGNGTMGQTFILRSDGSLFESQLSYFSSISGLDLTPGHVQGSLQDLDAAFGQRESPETAQRCFSCHTTASSSRGQLDEQRATPGVTCEACHGPGALHVKAMRANQFESGLKLILDPNSFGPVEQVDFCGACHRAPLDVAAAKDFVPINIRFQPYRLSKSRCWSRPDRRISCVGCHDPHDQLVEDVSFYDAKCLACHASGKSGETPGPQSPLAESGKLPACRVSDSRCVSCHMPKYKVAQMHGTFTDHDIRIVRPGVPFPL